MSQYDINGQPFRLEEEQLLPEYERYYRSLERSRPRNCDDLMAVLLRLESKLDRLLEGR